MSFHGKNSSNRWSGFRVPEQVRDARERLLRLAEWETRPRSVFITNSERAPISQFINPSPPPGYLTDSKLKHQKTTLPNATTSNSTSPIQLSESERAEESKSESNPPPLQFTNDVEIILIDMKDQPYAEGIEKSIKEFGLKVDIIIPKVVNENTMRLFIDNIAGMGAYFAIVITPENASLSSVTVHVLRGVTRSEQHRNMPLKVALKFIKEIYPKIRIKELGEFDKDSVEIFQKIIDTKLIEDCEYKKLLNLIQERWKRQRAIERKTDLISPTLQHELQTKILTILGHSRYSNASLQKRTAQINKELMLNRTSTDTNPQILSEKTSTRVVELKKEVKLVPLAPPVVEKSSPAVKFSITPANSNIECHNCFVKGHVAKFCPNEKKSSKEFFNRPQNVEFKHKQSDRRWSKYCDNRGFDPYKKPWFTNKK